MKVVWLCQSRGVHENRFISAFESHGHEVSCLTWDEVLTAPERFKQSAPDLAIGGPLHVGAQYFAALNGIPFVAISYAYDVLYEARQNDAARESVLAALHGCRGFIADCDAVITAMRELCGAALPPHVRYPWGLEHPPRANEQQIKQVNRMFESLTKQGVRRVLICTRNFTVMHGTLLVAEVFVDLAGLYPDLGLILAGDGPLREEIGALLRETALDHRVVMTGLLEEAEVIECLKRADCFVGASQVDGTSISLLQALNAGLPIVVPDVGGNTEWAEQTEGCLTFQAGSRKALLSALDDALKRWPARRFDRSALMAARCDWRSNSAALVKFCNDLAGNCHDGAPTGCAPA